MGGQGRWPMTAPAQRGITAMAAHDIEPGRPGEAKVSDGQTAALPLDRHGWHAGLESHLVPRTPGTTATAAAARPRTRAPGLGAPGPDRPGRQRLEPDDQQARSPLPGPARR